MTQATPPAETDDAADHPTLGLRPVVEREVRSAVVPGLVWIALQAVGLLVGITLVGRHGGGPVQTLDDRVHGWFLDHRSGLVGFSLVIAKVGNAPELGVLVVIVTAVLVATWRHRRALVLFAAYLGAEVTVYVIRLVVKRPRPLSADFPGPGALRGVHETSWSFPSGHATAVTAVLVALAGMAVFRSKRTWVWCLGLLGGIVAAASRLVLGVHWFTDVTTGLVLGAVWGTVAVHWLGRPPLGVDRPERIP